MKEVAKIALHSFNALKYFVLLIAGANIIVITYLLFGNFNYTGIIFFYNFTLLFFMSFILTSAVLSSFNYIISIVYLIFLFSISGLFFMFCGVNFVGLTLIAVYVGGVLLLFLSVIKFLGFKAGDSLYNLSLRKFVIVACFILFVFFVLSALFILANENFTLFCGLLVNKG